MKPELKGVQETMFIPLAIRAEETLRAHARIHDFKAVEIIQKLGMDTGNYDKFMSHEGVVARTLMFDRTLKSYLQKYPDAACINLGCGLDDRFSRVDNGRLIWYNVDLPDVIRIRKRFFTEKKREHMVAGSVLDSVWTEAAKKGSPAILIAEGLLMYFSREQVQTLLELAGRAFPDFILLAELMAPFSSGKGKYHDTVKHTTAEFGWGTKDGTELEQLLPGMKLLKESSFNEVMRKYTIRGRLFAALPKIRNLNNRLAVYAYGKIL